MADVGNIGLLSLRPDIGFATVSQAISSDSMPLAVNTTSEGGNMVSIS